MDQFEIGSLIDKGDCFYQDGDYDRAVDFYIRALELDIKSPEALEGLGQSYSALCSWERAASVFEQLVELEPDCGFSHYLYGQALGALGKHDEALAELRRAEDLGCSLAELYSSIGYSLHMKGDVEGALESYRLALHMDPDDTITCFNYSRALVAQGKYQAARRVLEDAVEVDPEDEETWIALGEVYEDLSDWNKALDAYERALDLVPDSLEARCLVGHCCLMLGRLDQAEWEYRQVIQDEPADGDAWAGLGEVLIAQERYHEALVACNRALEVEPTSPYALSGYVSACEHLGATEDARAAVAHAIGQDPKCPDLWYLLGGLEACAGDIEKSLAAYKRAVQINPLDAAAHAGIACVLLELGRNYPAVELHLIESARLAPDWYYPCLQLGELYLRRNDRESASEWFMRAVRLAPNDPNIKEAFSDPEIRELIEGGSAFPQ